MTWIKLFLLCIIVICLNYVGCHEYYRRDLTEDQRYDISQQSINMLQSPEIQNRKTPIKITFAFLRTTQNYTRMRSLLEEYERYSNGKVVVDYVDPLRQPNKAREISMIYGVEFRKNQVVIDAREDTEVALKDSAGNIPAGRRPCAHPLRRLLHRVRSRTGRQEHESRGPSD